MTTSAGAARIEAVAMILFEVTVFRGLALQFNFDYRTTLLLVLWALGWAMIVLSALIYLPRSAIAAVGLLLRALRAHPPHCRCGVLRALWGSALDV
jgi:uncharacterized membrane protein